MKTEIYYSNEVVCKKCKIDLIEFSHKETIKGNCKKIVSEKYCPNCGRIVINEKEMIEIDCRKCVNLGDDECIPYGKDAKVAVKKCASEGFACYVTVDELKKLESDELNDELNDELTN